jgi:hypothetical protein
MTDRAEEEQNDRRMRCRADLLRKKRSAEQIVEDQIYRTEKNGKK